MDILDLRDLADELELLIAEEEGGAGVDHQRIAALQDLESELGGSLRGIGENYEPTLIAEADFVEYAQELADDLGLIQDGLSWPLTCIDWDHAAREIRYDYTSVTLAGNSYLIRSW